MAMLASRRNERSKRITINAALREFCVDGIDASRGDEYACLLLREFHTATLVLCEMDYAIQ